MARVRKPAPPTGATVFVVQRRGNGVAECAFTDRSAAEADRRARDRSVRAWANPFDPGDPKSLCSTGANAFRRALKALGVRPAARGQQWRDWWEVVCSEITTEQREAVWDLLDNLHHHVVVEVPLED